MKKVAFAQNGRFVCSENAGDDQGLITVNRQAVGGWETHTVHPLGSNFVAVETSGGRFWSMQSDGRVVANRLRQSVQGPDGLRTVPDDVTSLAHDAWEAFEWLKNADGTISLRGWNGKFFGPFHIIVLEGDELSRIHVEGQNFVDDNGEVWMWRGATDFLLFKKFVDGVDIRPLLAQRRAAGANLVRVFSMCRNIADLSPSAHGDYYDRLSAFADLLASEQFYFEFTVFADAQLVMPSTSEQLAHWTRVCDVLRSKSNVFVELVNEQTHGGNGIDIARFPRPAGLLVSHGSNESDAHPIEPYWDYITVHIRRDQPPDARGFTNYDMFEFEANYPKPAPVIGDEAIKPHQYGYDTTFALLCGKHAGILNGGTFHPQSGVTSDVWNSGEEACAKAFFRGIQ